MPGNYFNNFPTPTVTTTYTLAGTDGWGCVTDSTITIFSCSTGIEPIETESIRFTVFPNPASDFITLQASPGSDLKEIGLLTIYNSRGELVFQTTCRNMEATIELGQFSSGLYIIQARNHNFRFIKN